MTKELARNALVFLSRVDLKGAEAPTFMEVVQGLTAMASAEAALPAVAESGPAE